MKISFHLNRDKNCEKIEAELPEFYEEVFEGKSQPGDMSYWLTSKEFQKMDVSDLNRHVCNFHCLIRPTKLKKTILTNFVSNVLGKELISTEVCKILIEEMKKQNYVFSLLEKEIEQNLDSEEGIEYIQQALTLLD